MAVSRDPLPAETYGGSLPSESVFVGVVAAWALHDGRYSLIESIGGGVIVCFAHLELLNLLKRFHMRLSIVMVSVAVWAFAGSMVGAAAFVLLDGGDMSSELLREMLAWRAAGTATLALLALFDRRDLVLNVAHRK